MVKIILASKSKVRKQILDNNNISTEVQNSNLDENVVKESLLKEKASPGLISKNRILFYWGLVGPVKHQLRFI